jgi:hypothetical protein
MTFIIVFNEFFHKTLPNKCLNFNFFICIKNFLIKRQKTLFENKNLISHNCNFLM